MASQLQRNKLSSSRKPVQVFADWIKFVLVSIINSFTIETEASSFSSSIREGKFKVVELCLEGWLIFGGVDWHCGGCGRT